MTRGATGGARAFKEFCHTSSPARPSVFSPPLPRLKSLRLLEVVVVQVDEVAEGDASASSVDSTTVHITSTNSTGNVLRLALDDSKTAHCSVGVVLCELVRKGYDRYSFYLVSVVYPSEYTSACDILLSVHGVQLHISRRPFQTQRL
jgi:hypothetical protein